MESLAAIFFTSLTVALTGALMPGPLLALTLKESLSRGRWAGLWLTSGHSLCELVMVGALVGGVSQLLPLESITGPVCVLGGAILFWMGIGALRQTPAETGSQANPRSRGPAHNLLLGGAVVTLTNPYWALWWLTPGLALVALASKTGVDGIIAFYVGHISADYLWFGLVGVAVGSGGKMLEARLYRRALQACGALLMLFGVLFAGYGGNAVFSNLLR